jgi:predicted metal-dependent HD superfamily phosphohydrolase
LKKFTWLHDWIFEKKQKDPDWKLSDSTVAYIKGIEDDLADLSQILGVDLCLTTIRHENDPNH